MSGLNREETEQLRDAYTRASSVAAGLITLSKAKNMTEQQRLELDAMVRSLKIAERSVKTVHSMKGHYPN